MRAPTTQQSRWEVAWTEPADVGVQTFEVDVVGVESASLVRYEASHEDAAYGCPDDHLEVVLQVDITSTDGEVASSGPAELLATALGDPTANLSFAHEATFGPVVLAHLEGEVPAGATVTGTHFRAGYGHIEIGVSWDGPESIGWDRVYHCTWEGFRQGSGHRLHDMTGRVTATMSWLSSSSRPQVLASQYVCCFLTQRVRVANLHRREET